MAAAVARRGISAAARFAGADCTTRTAWAVGAIGVAVKGRSARRGVGVRVGVEAGCAHRGTAFDWAGATIDSVGAAAARCL